MLDEPGSPTFFKQLHDQWIQPELDRRFGETGLPENFKIQQCLIKLPVDRPPIVEFNEEIQWELQIKVPADMGIKKDQIVYLHEIEDVVKAIPPMVDNKRVAFVYLFWAGYSYFGLDTHTK